MENRQGERQSTQKGRTKEQEMSVANQQNQKEKGLEYPLQKGTKK